MLFVLWLLFVAAAVDVAVSFDKLLITMCVIRGLCVCVCSTLCVHTFEWNIMYMYVCINGSNNVNVYVSRDALYHTSGAILTVPKLLSSKNKFITCKRDCATLSL